MLGQSKTSHQAEIDSACELADFLRFNVAQADDARIFEVLSRVLSQSNSAEHGA